VDRKTKARPALSVAKVYARRQVEALAARVRAKGEDSVAIRCPACSHEWPVPASELVGEKTCPACGHVWEARLEDYLLPQARTIAAVARS
jgi:hypothetical protein